MSGGGGAAVGQVGSPPCRYCIEGECSGASLACKVKIVSRGSAQGLGGIKLGGLRGCASHSSD